MGRHRLGCQPIFSEYDWPSSHATRGRDGRQKGRECGYYHLHRYLNDFLLHDSPPRLILVEAVVTIVVAVVTTAGIVAASGIVITASGISTAALTLRTSLVL